MIKKIIIGICFITLIFAAGSIYVIGTIQTTTSDLDNIITLHQVELLREHLLIEIKKVQRDLNLKDTRYARSYSTIVRDVQNMSGGIKICFNCHHPDNINKKLYDIKEHVNEYKEAISRVLTIRANSSRLFDEEDAAYRIGEELIAKVDNMILITSAKLEEKTQRTLVKIDSTKKIIFIVFLGSFITTMAVALFFIKGFTRPVKKLLDGTQELQKGNLEYRIEGLKDEFGNLASSVNDMANSLQEQMHMVEENEKRYRMLFESAGDSIFILEAEGEGAGRIVAANRAAEAMHGYTIDELLTLNIKDLSTQRAASEIPDRIRKALNGEKVKTEGRHLRKDGTVFPVEISEGLFELSDHKYILAFDRDITERKQAEAQFLRTEQMVVMGEVATGLAHEIKNPLAGIKASIELFSEVATLSGEERDILKMIIGEIKRIEALLKGMLNFAKPPKPDFSDVDVNNIIDTALTFSLKSAPSGQNSTAAIQVIKDLNINLPRIIADPMQLSQIFLNLFLNAVEAMKDGGVLTVSTSYNAQGNSIWIIISDTGKGIEKGFYEQIFHPFFTTKPKGTGLGLAITKRLIEQHGGLLTVGNNQNGGATFMISLPVKQKETTLPV
ncbi:MAG: PAS domain S-box protein [Nitrospirae bacterium]|nr:PAS domain S-box protein [Nitrospirota bacterium]